MTESSHIRRYVDIALFGAVGGALEAVLGTITHWFRFVPFAGVIPTAALIGVLSAFYVFSKSSRDVAFCGLVIAFLKLLSPGGIIIIAVLSVFIETVLFCVIVKLTPGPRPIKLALAGAIVAIWPIVHKLINLTIIVGIAAPEAVNDLINKIQQFFQTTHISLPLLIMTVLMIHIFIGVSSALAGYKIGNRLRSHRERQ